MENQKYRIASRMKHVFPSTYILWQKCASPQGLTFHTHAKEYVVVINISLI